MATILAYTSPAMGHLLPMSALLQELAGRGHTIHMRTVSSGVEIGENLGFATDTIDPRIEALELDDWKAKSGWGALKLGIAAFGRRAGFEVADLAGAVEKVHPDALLIDVNCWGARSAAEAAGISWASFAPYTPPLQVRGVPPFGLGLRPWPGALGQIRDAAVRATVLAALERIILPPINRVRAEVQVLPVNSTDEFLRRAPLMLVASGKPFQYRNTDWGAAVQMIGPCLLDPGDAAPDWLGEIELPIVLATTSSELQDDAGLVAVTAAALADDPVHVVATMPAGLRSDIVSTSKMTVCQFVPHGVVLDRAVCAVTHGGMGATQKALAHGVPVCVVPFGRDQFEVARRVEVAGCGTWLRAGRLSPGRLRAKVHASMGMAAGARRVAAGFAETGGTPRGADLFEERVLGV